MSYIDKPTIQMAANHLKLIVGLRLNGCKPLILSFPLLLFNTVEVKKMSNPSWLIPPFLQPGYLKLDWNF